MKHFECIKGLGLLFSIFFILACAADSSDDEFKVSVTVVQSSSSGDSNDEKTVINTYTKESDSPETNVKCSISGSSSSVIASGEDEITAESDDLDVMQSDLQLDGFMSEEFNDELSKWISLMLKEDPLLAIDDFPQDVTDIVRVE